MSRVKSRQPSKGPSQKNNSQTRGEHRRRPKEEQRTPEKREDRRTPETRAKQRPTKHGDRPSPVTGFPGRPEEPREERDDVLEGRNPVMEAMKAGRSINKLIIAKGSREGSIREIIGLARDIGIPITEVERHVLDLQAPTRGHQGVMAYVSPKNYVEVDEILAIARQKGEAPFVLVLDELEDPHNVGALLRTADGAGVHGVIIPKRRGVAITSAVAKSSAGAVEHIAIARVTNLVQSVEFLKKEGLWIIGSDQDAPKAFYEQDFKGPVGLIIGSEGKGISRLLQSKCDFLVSIPMSGMIQSLNASVAGALLMYERNRQIKIGKGGNGQGDLR